MPTELLKHHSNGHTLKVTTEGGQDTGQRVYKSRVGQKNVDLGDGNFEPYVWYDSIKTVRYSNLLCEFYSAGYQVVREYSSGKVLVDDQRFEVQYWDDPQWRTLDLWQIGLTVDDTNEDFCVVTRKLSDGLGNTLDVDFLFEPKEEVKLTFRLRVVDADQYRIRFQNSGIAGEVTEVPFIRRSDQSVLGIGELLFDNIRFKWLSNEIGIHTGYTIEDQAGGKKLDFFLGDFDLPANGSVTVSPTTWGPTTTSDDCSSYGGAYEDDYEGDIFVGIYDSNIEHMGLTFSNVAVPAGAETQVGTKITITAASIDGTQTDCYLTVCDSRDVGAWGAENLPEDQTEHSTTVPWNPNESSGSHDSPELKDPVQDRFDGDAAAAHVENDPLTVIWMSGMSSGTGEQAITADDAELTIVYTPGTSKVTSDSEAVFDVYNKANSDIEAVYDVRNKIASDIEGLFDIFNKVSSDLEMVFDVYLRVASDSESVFDIFNAVRSDIEMVFDVANIVNSDSTIVYDQFQLASSDVEFVYDQAGRVKADSELVYDVKNIVFSDIEGVFDVLNSIYADTTLKYDQFEKISSDIEAVFDVVGRVASDSELVYDMAGRIKSSLELVFDVLSKVNADSILKYDVFSKILSDLERVYDQFERMDSDLELVYDLFSKVNSDLEAVFDVLKKLNSDSEYVFDINIKALSDLELVFDVESTKAISDAIIVYDVFSDAARGKGLNRLGLSTRLD